MVESLSCLHQSLMSTFDHIFPGGEMLCKYFTIILILFTLLSQIRIFYPDDRWLFFIVNLIKFDLFKGHLRIIFFPFEARNESIAVRLDD